MNKNQKEKEHQNNSQIVDYKDSIYLFSIYQLYNLLFYFLLLLTND